MTETVVSLRGQPIATDAKTEFLRHVADSFDYYVEKRGAEPDALVFTWAGVRQDAHTAWMMRGESERAMTTVQALALVSLTKAIVNPEPME